MVERVFSFYEIFFHRTGNVMSDGTIEIDGTKQYEGYISNKKVKDDVYFREVLAHYNKSRMYTTSNVNENLLNTNPKGERYE